MAFGLTPALDYFVDPAAPEALPTWSPNWVTLASGPDLTTLAGGGAAALASASAQAKNYYVPLSLTDFESWIEILTIDVAVTIYGRVVQVTPTTSGYAFQVLSGGTWVLSRVTNSSGTTLRSGVITAPQPGDAIGISGVGSWITAWYRTGKTGLWRIISGVYDNAWSAAGVLAFGCASTVSTSVLVFGGGIPVVPPQSLVPLAVAGQGPA